MHAINSMPAEQAAEVHQPGMLKPLIDPIISTLINQSPGILTELVKFHGSPLNLVWPHAFELNTLALLAVLKQHNLSYEMFYGAKANKSQSLLEAAAQSAIGIDVSSIHELHAALRAGACAARRNGRDPRRHRHGARRRSGIDLPPAGYAGPFAGAHRARSARPRTPPRASVPGSHRGAPGSRHRCAPRRGPSRRSCICARRAGSVMSWAAFSRTKRLRPPSSTMPFIMPPAIMVACRSNNGRKG